MAKKKTVTVVTPPGVLAFTYIHAPDAKGKSKYGNDKYKATHVYDRDTDLSGVEAKCVAVAKEAFPNVKLEDIQMPFKDGDEYAAKEKNEGDRDEFRGKVFIRTSSKFAPAVCDSKRNPLPAGVQARAGDIARLSLGVVPYESTEDVVEVVKGKKQRTTVTTYGITLQLRAVQLVEKRAMGAGSANDFDDFDGGYEADTSDDNAAPQGGGEGGAGGDDF